MKKNKNICNEEIEKKRMFWRGHFQLICSWHVNDVTHLIYIYDAC